MDRPQLAIIIPAFNERESIAEVVRSASGSGAVIVVDDASQDGTAEAARQAGAQVISHSVNQGYDGALNTGFKQAEAIGCEAAITLDADGQHPAELLEVFAEHLSGSVDMVAGFRPRKSRAAEHLFGLITRLLCGLKDPLCGMKGYSMQVYRELGHFDCYQSIGTELVLFAARRKKRIIQVPVPIAKRQGNSRFGIGLKSNLRILRALAKGLAHWRNQSWTASYGATKVIATPKEL